MIECQVYAPGKKRDPAEDDDVELSAPHRRLSPKSMPPGVDRPIGAVMICGRKTGSTQVEGLNATGFAISRGDFLKRFAKSLISGRSDRYLMTGDLVLMTAIYDVFLCECGSQ